MNDCFKLSGKFNLFVRERSSHRIKDGRVVHNLIVTSGKAGAASRMIGPAVDPFIFLALGTGTTAAAAGDTTLQAEIEDTGLQRIEAGTSLVTTTVTDDTFQLDNSFTATGSKTVAEIGIFSLVEDGVMLCRQVFTGIALINTDDFGVQYRVVCS